VPLAAGRRDRMRSPLASLVLCAVAAAGDPSGSDRLPALLKAFEEERARAFEAGARSGVYPALEALAATRDVRAVPPLAGLLADAVRAGPALQEAFRTVQKRGSQARNRLEEIGQKLALLREREKAGATDVGPEIRKLEAQRSEAARAFEQAQLEVGDLDRRRTYLDELREKLAVALTGVLAALRGDAAEGAIAALRGTLDMASREESLYLVRILRNSKVPEASRHLVEILEHPKAPAPTLAAAASAVVPLGDIDALRAVVRLWRRDPEGAGPQVQVAISLAAKREVRTPDEADAWIEALSREKAK